MPLDLDPSSLERRARRRVGVKIGFLAHLSAYVLVNTALQGLNLLSGGPHWSVWPALGWGLGLAAHGLATLFALAGEGWRERWLQREIERLRRSPG